MLLDAEVKQKAPLSADPFASIMDVLNGHAVGGGGEAVLSGSAGTGKTTLTRRVIQDWGSENVTLLAPTGKATRRLTEVTGVKANTVHSTLYGGPVENPDTGELEWNDPQPIGGEGQLVIIDEASMVGLELATDIRIGIVDGTVVLWVGDPYQLPPVNDAPGVDLTHPDVLLTKVHRSGDGVMAFAYDVLRAKVAPALSQVIQGAFARDGIFNPGSVGVAGSVTPEHWRSRTIESGSDSVLITYRNLNRHQINNNTRAQLGYPSDELRVGEPLVVMSTNRQMGLANGELVRIVAFNHGEDPDCPLHLVQLTVETSDGKRVRVYTDPRGFAQDTREWREARREDAQSWRYRMAKFREIKNPKWRAQAEAINSGDIARTTIPGPPGEAVHLHFGYCLTCHKMQGSEADHVGIVWSGLDEVGRQWSDWWWLKKDLETARSWWYTAATRPRKSLILWK